MSEMIAFHAAAKDQGDIFHVQFGYRRGLEAIPAQLLSAPKSIPCIAPSIVFRMHRRSQQDKLHNPCPRIIPNLVMAQSEIMTLTQTPNCQRKSGLAICRVP